MESSFRDGLAAAADQLLPIVGAAARRSDPKRAHRALFSTVTPESVLRSFNTRAFRREQPDNPAFLSRIVSEAISRKEAIHFVLYWGKGLRSYLGAPEFKCLDYLTCLSSRVRRSYAAGARVTLIFTDTHAELNGHSKESINAYFEDLSQSACRHDFETCRLGTLTHNHERPSDPITPAHLPQQLFSSLCASAAKWFKGNGTIEEGAIRYFQLNMLEKQIVEQTFPRSIFVTFNRSELRPLLPDRLPIFFMYSLRQGVCAKPWFLPIDAPNNLDLAGPLDALHGD